MRYIIKQKVWSLADRFTIKDEYENDKFFVTSKYFTLGRKLYLEDVHGNSLFYIEQKLFKILPVYEIYKGDQLFAVLRKKLAFLKARIEIDQNGTPYFIAGDVLSHEFTIVRADTVVACVSKTWFAFADTYGVEISTGENDAFIIALTICIDQILYDKKSWL
ncbi:MAG TPA: LURP-one-related family protein [Bacteroidales bacterium]|nr:LURP-one-related family protein [Bacteroidales bacterium]